MSNLSYFQTKKLTVAQAPELPPPSLSVSKPKLKREPTSPVLPTFPRKKARGRSLSEDDSNDGSNRPTPEEITISDSDDPNDRRLTFAELSIRRREAVPYLRKYWNPGDFSDMKATTVREDLQRYFMATKFVDIVKEAKWRVPKGKPCRVI
jgi:hypothetical protein